MWSIWNVFLKKKNFEIFKMAYKLISTTVRFIFFHRFVFNRTISFLTYKLELLQLLHHTEFGLLRTLCFLISILTFDWHKNKQTNRQLFKLISLTRMRWGQISYLSCFHLLRYLFSFDMSINKEIAFLPPIFCKHVQIHIQTHNKRIKILLSSKTQVYYMIPFEIVYGH